MTAAQQPVAPIERWRALPANLRGALWMLASTLCFACMAVLIKSLGHRLDSTQLAFCRSAFGLATLLPFAIHRGLLWTIHTHHLRMHISRSLLGIVGMSCSFYALTHLPLATVTAIGFAKPLFVIVLAVLFLGEQVRWRRWSATVVGFLGVLLMLRPGQGEFQPAALVAIGGVLVVAFVVILVKKLSHTERPLTMLVYFAMTASAVLAWPAATVWQAPSLAEWPFLVLMGVLATTGQACVILSYRVGEATAVTPIGYAQLLFATLAGIAFFSEWPDAWTLAGAGIIVASTVYIAQREHRIGKGLAPEQKAQSLFVRQT